MKTTTHQHGATSESAQAPAAAGSRAFQPTPAAAATPAATHAPPGVAQQLRRLQRTHGNRFVQRLLTLARHAGNHGPAPEPMDVGPDVETAIQTARDRGRPIDEGVRGRMETAFGANFAHVRIHTGADADALNQTLHARAFTTGRDIFFRQGEYSPESAGGRELLAHELTHVVQQGGAASAGPATAASGHAQGATPGAVQRMCQECEEEEREGTVQRRLIQPKLVVSPPDDAYEQEADAVARAVIQWEARGATPTDANAGATSDGAGSDGALASVAQASSGHALGATIGRVIQRTPSAGSNFGTYRYCGFGITTPIPGFIKDLFTGDFDVDYTTGCTWIAVHAWSSVWELYDAADVKVDSDTESPFGDYTIASSDVNGGTPGDGSAKWSLWYRITKSQPWLTDDNDAYPYHYVEFPVYSTAMRNPSTKLTTEVGPVVWQDNFTPAEDGASLSYSVSASGSRSTTDTQAVSLSGTVGGQRNSNLSFSYNGLTGGFASALSFSATASLSRSHSVTVSTSETMSKTFNQPNLRAGVTYSVEFRPLYHIIDGTVDRISHRDGVITGSGGTLTGGIRVLKGMDIAINPTNIATIQWSCDARCNVEGTEPQCTGRVEGSSSGHPSEEIACREAKRDATQKAPRGCYARHCRCLNCANH